MPQEVFGHVEVNTKELVAKAVSQEQASVTLWAIQLLLAITLGFDLVDRWVTKIKSKMKLYTGADVLWIVAS
jgi:hypothetical protein|eukprot:COSAG01_NODE_18328_length_1084_cov_1.768528_3_plen_72_part_00